MNKIDKLERWIAYLIGGRVIQEISLFTASVLSVIKGRTDFACYFLVLSIWIGGQMAQFQNGLTTRYNRLLDEKERRGGL